MVHILVLNWNDADNTINCLKNIKEDVILRKKIILIDNNSEDDSLNQIINYVKNYLKIKFYNREMICKLWKNKSSIEDNEDLIVIKNDKNGGFAYGNNSGIMYSLLSKNCDFVWLLNNDTEIEPNSLSSILNEFKNDNNLGMCGSVILDYYKRELIQCYGGGNFYKYFGKFKLYLKNAKLTILNTKKINKPSYLIGASLCVKKECLQEIGLMDENYFMFSEEIDWQYEAIHRGWGIGVAKESHIFHKGSVSTGGKSPDYYYMVNKSAIIFIKKKYGITISIIAGFNLIIISLIQNTKSFKKIMFSILGIVDGFRKNGSHEDIKI